MKKFLATLLLSCVIFAGCEPTQPRHETADQKINHQQESMAQQANAEAGLPGIHNFTEKKTMKMILEKRDTAKLVTFAYAWAPMIGKFKYIGTGYGYPIPYATQYTSPMRAALSRETEERGNIALPQQDPNGLFSPASADATWWLMMDETTKTIDAAYIEEKVNVFTHKLPSRLVIQD